MWGWAVPAACVLFLLWFLLRPRPVRWNIPERLDVSPALERARQRERERPPADARGVTTMKRAVGYCGSVECEDYAKGVFLLNHSDTFHCPRCRQIGFQEKEGGQYTGNHEWFAEVRVEYNFDPINGTYREIAIVRDESLGRGNTYILNSPLIKTERRALKVAEAILSNLNRYGLGTGEIPRTTEQLLSFDSPLEEFTAQCAQLAKELEKSGLAEGADSK